MASIKRTEAGTYKVRFRTPEGASRSKTFPRRAQADAFAATVEVSTPDSVPASLETAVNNDAGAAASNIPSEQNQASQ